jgi:hypothetical protein
MKPYYTPYLDERAAASIMSVWGFIGASLASRRRISGGSDGPRLVHAARRHARVAPAQPPGPRPPLALHRANYNIKYVIKL